MREEAAAFRGRLLGGFKCYVVSNVAVPVIVNVSATPGGTQVSVPMGDGIGMAVTSAA